MHQRAYGTNHVNNCSFYCHQASGVALGRALGSGAGTVTLEDLEACDLVFLVGANPASNHPRFMRTLMELRRRGGTVVVVNPIRELGLVRFKVPSDVRSLLLGSAIASEVVQPHAGGDLAFFAGVAKALVAAGAVDQAFIDAHTEGSASLLASLEALSWEALEASAGVPREVMERSAALYGASQRTIFAWTVGITQHRHGVENVQMLANLAFLRGMIGRPGAGLLPLRGHSNVQGVGSMGVTPKLKAAALRALEKALGPLPAEPGLDTLASLERAEAGGFRFACCLGGNLFGASPDAEFAARALSRVGLVVYLSTALNTGHAWGRGEETLILPVRARDEEAAPTTQESMFSYVRLSDGGPARHEGPRGEVEVLASIAEQTLGADGEARRSPFDWSQLREHGNLRQAIARLVPGYEPIAAIDESRQEFRIAGRALHDEAFGTTTGRARFVDCVQALPPPVEATESGNAFRLTTLRSEGQFNTVVYEDEDLYRGQSRRDVVMMHASDIERLGLAEDARVTVRSAAGALSNVLLRRLDIRPGNVAMYFPEANVLVPRVSDPLSHTPAFKSVSVTITADAAGAKLVQLGRGPTPVEPGDASP